MTNQRAPHEDQPDFFTQKTPREDRIMYDTLPVGYRPVRVVQTERSDEAFDRLERDAARAAVETPLSEVTGSRLSRVAQAARHIGSTIAGRLLSDEGIPVWRNSHTSTAQQLEHQFNQPTAPHPQEQGPEQLPPHDR